MDLLECEYIARTILNRYAKSYRYNVDWIPNYVYDKIKGICDYDNRLIMLNRNFVFNNNREIISKVILHEIAHVLTKGHKHDLVFVQKCHDLGLKDRRFILGD